MYIFSILCLLSILGSLLALKNPICADSLLGFGVCNTIITRIGYNPWTNDCTSKNFVACGVYGTAYNSIKECEDKCKE
ncbi:boophilin-H2 [Drosophila takahashii]|uniref:boophilin-H2 n=1 Tax=Drosophila takahashii TaxID=29030 RepID=UPI0007E7144D|nr:uncharacterized protein LOC108068780 [Drosophila takahashii]